MKWKLWLRQLSVSGPNVAVRTQLPWPLRALVLVALLAFAVAAGFWSSGRGGSPDGADPRIVESELERTRMELQQTLAERDRYAALAVQRESQIHIDRVAHQQLEKQLKALEEDNARLKADLSFFESLLPTPANAKGVVIRSFRIQADDEPDRLRYRLLVQQSGRPDRDFVGDVSLVVNLQQGGRDWVLSLPDPAVPDAGPAALSFRHYQRVEGTFTLPPGAVIRSVLVKISADGQTQAQQTFSM
jgi:hypothetical protein